MRDEEIRQLIMKLLAEAKSGAGHGGDTADAPAADGRLQLSSLELVRLLVALEDDLDIELEDETVMNTKLSTVDDVVALVRDSLASPTG
jgi:acyl carrier protein